MTPVRPTAFDDIEVRRPEPAQAYLALVRGQPARPLALVAPRRIGKTNFLLVDLTPAARAAGLHPVYVDLWLARAEPLAAINHALEEALDDLTVPRSTVGRRDRGIVGSASARRAAGAIDDPLLVEYLCATVPPLAIPGASSPTRAPAGSA